MTYVGGSSQRAATARMFWMGGFATLQAAYVPVPLVICGPFISAVDVEASFRYWL